MITCKNCGQKYDVYFYLLPHEKIDLGLDPFENSETKYCPKCLKQEYEKVIRRRDNGFCKLLRS